MPSGMCASAPPSRTQTYSACAPDRTPKTRSPTANSRTALPDLLHLARQLDAGDLLLRSAQTGDEAADEELGAAQPGVRPRDRRREDLGPGPRRPVGTGRSTSSTRRISGGPYLSWTTARILVLVVTTLYPSRQLWSMRPQHSARAESDEFRAARASPSRTYGGGAPMSANSSWPKGVAAITLFVEDLGGGEAVLPSRSSTCPCSSRTTTRPRSGSGTRSSTC